MANDPHATSSPSSKSSRVACAGRDGNIESKWTSRRCISLLLTPRLNEIREKFWSARCEQPSVHVSHVCNSVPLVWSAQLLINLLLIQLCDKLNLKFHEITGATITMPIWNSSLQYGLLHYTSKYTMQSNSKQLRLRRKKWISWDKHLPQRRELARFSRPWTGHNAAIFCGHLFQRLR